MKKEPVKVNDSGGMVTKGHSPEVRAKNQDSKGNSRALAHMHDLTGIVDK